MRGAEINTVRRGDLELLLSKDIECVFWTPERLGQPSGWWGHVPFAFWITVASKPGLVVELGTYRGISYAAFCEAVVRSRLETRCWAVDTWEGDDHVGRYGDDIFNDFNDFHDKHYASFSRILRMKFDDACGMFEDKTIDLLHIDGYHTYEAVKHDFETWRPKLSERAVVLFHDTNNELKGDIGVNRFFDELKKEMPTFEFLHSFGLGVAAVGDKAPDCVKALCGLSDDEAISSARERFAHLGACWEKAELAEQLRNGVAHQKHLDAAIRDAQSAYSSLTEVIGSKDAALRDAQSHYDKVHQILVSKLAENEEMQAEIIKQRAEIAELKKPFWQKLISTGTKQ